MNDIDPRFGSINDDNDTTYADISKVDVRAKQHEFPFPNKTDFLQVDYTNEQMNADTD